jgi:hypothetical protein
MKIHPHVLELFHAYRRGLSKGNRYSVGSQTHLKMANGEAAFWIIHAQIIRNYTVVVKLNIYALIAGSLFQFHYSLISFLIFQIVILYQVIRQYFAQDT